MTNLHCSNIAQLFNLLPAENAQGPDVQLDVDLSSQNAEQVIVDKCMGFLTLRFIESIPRQVERFIVHEQYQNHTIIINDTKIAIKHYSINPSLFELTASKIAHYLFPNNFAEYKFIITPNMNVSNEIDAGYLPSGDIDPKCSAKHIDGIENVYATAFYLGLEIQSHECVNLGDKAYLFIDDFSYPFHRVDSEQKILLEEYRDHKMSPSDEGTLFPNFILNPSCGEWLGRECDLAKLKAAYKRIIDIPKDSINNIIDAAIHVLQSIECVDNKDDNCKSSSYYLYLNEEVKAILLGNYNSIASWYDNEVN